MSDLLIFYFFYYFIIFCVFIDTSFYTDRFKTNLSVSFCLYFKAVLTLSLVRLRVFCWFSFFLLWVCAETPV